MISSFNYLTNYYAQYSTKQNNTEPKLINQVWWKNQWWY